MPVARAAGRFDASQRVRKHLEFQQAQRRGRRVTTPHFILIVHARDDVLPPRLGVVASRKVGPAVDRNRGKRLVREAFRATRDLWMPGMDLVVIVRQPPSNLKLADVVSEWRAVAGALGRRWADARGDQARRADQLGEHPEGSAS